MAFFKPIYKKMSKKWHPQAVSVGKPIEMDELCKQIALISTVSSADSKATHRQRRGHGRKGERQPNLRYPRPLHPRVAPPR